MNAPIFKRILIILFFYGCNVHLTYSQYGKPIHYTQENGLTTESMFSCKIDNEGFVWFASETGASRFNGKEFEHYKANEGIVANSILGFNIDAKNRIWASSLSGEINYFWQGEWHQTEKLKSIVKAQGHLNYDRSNLKIINDILVIPTSNSIILMYFNEQNELQLKTFKEHLYEAEPLLHLEIIDKQLKLITDSRFIYLDISFIKTDQPNTPDIGYYFQNDNKINFYKSGKLYKVKTPELYSIHYIYLKDNFLYVASESGIDKLKKVNDTLFIKDSKPLLDIPCVSLALDKNNNLWVCSQFDGVYFFPYQFGQSITYPELKGDFLLKTLEVKPFKYKAISSYGKIITFDGNTSKIERNLNLTTYDFQLHNGNEYFLSSNQLIKNKLTIFDRFGWYKSMVITGQEARIYIGCGDRLLQIQPTYKSLVVYKSSNRIYGLLQYNNHLLLGTDNGAFEYKDSCLYPFDLGRYSNTKNIASITLSQDSTLFFLIRNLGVILKKQNQQILLKEHSELLSEPTCVFSAKSGVLMIGTRKGLNVVHYAINPLKIQFIKSYTNTNGLIENKVNNINFNESKNEIIITFNNAIQILPANLLLQREQDSKLYFKYINSENIGYKFFDNVVFNYNENNLEIGFSAIDYASESAKGYTYRLVGLSDKWSIISGSSVKFSDLNPGFYTFELKTNNNYNSGNIIQLKFQILPAFWQTVWFKLTLFILILLFLYFLAKWYLLKVKRALEEKANVKSKIADLELEAQKTRLKPHFIFNCLTAIQYYIKKNQFSKADDYLVNFSRLIRQSLDLSNSDETTVEQEISFTTRYIELEHMRFNGLFEYEIKIDRKLLRDKMPSLILQTFAENAINHGLRYKENGKGLLSLEIKTVNVNCFEIIISDNGIGVENAKAYKKEGHVSKGLDIINQRIDAYNKKYTTNIVIFSSINNNDEDDKGYKTTINICKKTI